MERHQIFIMCFSFYMLFLAVSAQGVENSKLAIYYGDPKINVGDPFSITCIIPITDPIQWFKDGETIRNHNLRHGKDAHAFLESEHAIEGESDKIEAKIKVNSALEIHEGKYQCNALHSNYHYLRVMANKRGNNQQRIGNTKIPNFTTAVGLPLSTEEIAETFHENRFINDKYSFENMHTGDNNQHILNEYIGESSSEKSYTPQVSSSEENTKVASDNRKANNKINLESTRKPLDVKHILVPNYDNADKGIKVFEVKYALVLSCNISKEGDYELKWEKNGTDVAKIEALKGRFKIIKPERKFIIEKTEAKDAGLYSCSVNENDLHDKRLFTVVANVAVRVPSNTGVVEGEKLSIHCTVIGTDPEIVWQYGNLTLLNSTDKYILKEDDNKISNAILTIENASLEDRGEYKCIARNLATEYAKFSPASDVSFVRVKGKLAALWPFLGICAEVFILCAIILIYERRRNKTELEESDTDPNTEQKKKRRIYK